MKKEKKVLKGVKVVDLFCGIGGFHQAFASFGANIIWASEWDEATAKVYEDNYNLKPFGDITKINEKDIPDHDILCAGFPCQAFSISGNQLGFEDTRGTLFFDVVRIAKEKKPKIVFLENVKNLVKHDKGNTLKVILSSLEEIGYTPYYKVLNALDYGVPQNRDRIYIVAIRKDLNVSSFEFPMKVNLEKHLENILEDNIKTKDFIINRNDVVLNKTKEASVNKPLRLGQVGKGGQGERIYSIKGCAITLSAYGGGIGAKTGLYKIEDDIRKLSPRECARLDGFPDTFKIPENKNLAYRQFGNSVVIDVLQSIIESIIQNDEILNTLVKK